MIRLATSGDEAAVLRATAWQPVTGPLLEMHWRLWVENHHMPHRFYLAGDSVLKLSGRRATLCGIPADGEEAAAFLAFNRVGRLTALDWAPPGWRVLHNGAAMLCPSRAAPQPPPLPPGFDAEPPVDEVLAVLESTDGRMTPEGVREGFWVDAHIRRNHGVARVYGIREGGRLVCTAGAWAITPAAAYIACVETRPEARRRGYAAALVARLAADCAPRPVSLGCEDAMAAYYGRLGFAPTGHRVLVSAGPDES